MVNVRQFLPPVLFVGGIVALVALGWRGEPTVDLVDFTEGPRTPVTADPTTRPIVLRGLMARLNFTGNALRKERNEIATRHAEAVELWRAGKLPLRSVEGLEQLLWVARFKVGEVSAETMHAELAVLFGREVRRLELLAAMNLAGTDDLELARLYTARERTLAGLKVEDADGRDYAALRKHYLDEFRRRNELLMERGIGSREHMELEWSALQEDFPETLPVKGTG